MIVYLVLKHLPDDPTCASVEVQGIFSAEGAARAACKGPDHTYMQVTLDYEYPQESTNDSVIHNPAQNLVWLPGATGWTPVQST